MFSSSVVHFEAEARAFIQSGSVLDCSLYEGRASIREAARYAESIADLPSLPTTVVADVGLTDAGWDLIEFNPTWGSGLNGCSPELVYPAIAAAVVGGGAQAV